MGRPICAASLGVVLGLCGILRAQTSQPAVTQPGKLAFALPSVLDQAVAVAPTSLQPVLLQSIQPRWVSLNSSVATELSSLPNASPASAIRFMWDPESGTLQANLQSLGPILTERAETIGKNKFLVAITNQNYSFDSLDKLDLRGFEVAYPLNIPASSIVPQAPAGLLIPGLIVADAYINLKVNETTAHFTYGITHWLDASFALSMVTSSLVIRGNAVLRELVTGQSVVTLPTQLVQIASTGVGDSVVRLKANLLSGPAGQTGGKELKSRKLKLAMAADFRLPTGDEFDYHGAGAYSVKPFLIASLTNKFISPHLNAGFQWNGKSYLASQYPTEKRRLPSQLSYAAGFDASLSPRMTVAFDLLDQMVISGQRTLLQPLDTSDGNHYSQIYFADSTRNEFNASAGIKAQLIPRVLVTGNVMFRLNEAGLRARIVPLVGLSYLF
jgi:hypothetical protein